MIDITLKQYVYHLLHTPTEWKFLDYTLTITYTHIKTGLSITVDRWDEKNTEISFKVGNVNITHSPFLWWGLKKRIKNLDTHFQRMEIQHALKDIV
jgi:hypothetical protein